MKEEWLLIVIFICLLSGCSKKHEGRSINNLFIGKNNVTLSATKKKINEILKPVDMSIYDDYLVFQNEYPKEDHWFYVYTKNMEFRFSFALFGRGPHEFIAPRIIKNGSGNIISIFDASSYSIKKYSINPDNVTFLEEYKMEAYPYPIQEMAYVNDSIVIQMAISNNGTALYSSNIFNNERIDTTFFHTGFKVKMGENYNPTIDNFRFSNIGGQFVAALHYVNDIIIGEIDGNGYFTKREYTVENCDFPISKNIYDNTLYHIYPAIFEEYLLIPYYGYPFRETVPFPVNLKGRHFDFIIEVYDWSKNPLFSITLDSEFFRLYVSPIDKKMYVWNIMEDFDYILEYDLSIIHAYR